MRKPTLRLKMMMVWKWIEENSFVYLLEIYFVIDKTTVLFSASRHELNAAQLVN